VNDGLIYDWNHQGEAPRPSRIKASTTVLTEQEILREIEAARPGATRRLDA